MEGEITYHDGGTSRKFKRGDTVLEAGSTPHWWTNDGQQVVVLHAIDVYDTRTPGSEALI